MIIYTAGNHTISLVVFSFFIRSICALAPSVFKVVQEDKTVSLLNDKICLLNHGCWTATGNRMWRKGSRAGLGRVRICHSSPVRLWQWTIMQRFAQDTLMSTPEVSQCALNIDKMVWEVHNIALTVCDHCSERSMLNITSCDREALLSIQALMDLIGWWA